MLAVICDDQTADREVLLDFCARYQKQTGLTLTTLSFENAGALLQSGKAREAAVIFLDIYLEGASGIEAARILRSRDFTGAIVFTTTSQEHYADGFALEAAHYLQKPISWPAFCEAMRRVQKRFPAPARTIRVSVGRTELDLAVNAIHYIEVYGHKTTLYTDQGELHVNQSLSALEKKLGGDPFLRCYRCFIIHMGFVKRMKEHCFLMKDGREIPFSRDGRAALKSRYMQYLFQRMGESS